MAALDPEKDNDAFFQALANQGHLGSVLQGTLYVERQLIRYVEEKLPFPGELERLHLGYDQWIQLALALGMNKSRASPLRALGTLRNYFAHVAEAALTADRVDNYYNSFPGEDKVRFPRLFANVREGSKPADFKRAEPLERFQVMTVSLRVSLIAARLELTLSSQTDASSSTKEA